MLLCFEYLLLYLIVIVCKIIGNNVTLHDYGLGDSFKLLDLYLENKYCLPLLPCLTFDKILCLEFFLSK